MIPLSIIFVIIAFGGAFLALIRSFYYIKSSSDSSADKAVIFWFLPFAIIAVILALFKK